MPSAKTDKSSSFDLCCIIAGGGTGGHLFPGIAVAQELEERFKKSEIYFITGHKRMEDQILANYGYKVRNIEVEGIKGRELSKVIPALIKLPLSLFQAISLIRQINPGLVLGMGGYSSGPVCLAAKYMGIYTAIHEQNSYPGLTNRLLARFVEQVFISFEESRGLLKSKNIVMTGNPVRQDLFKETKNPLKQAVFRILILGGSQGARAINEAFVAALEYLNGLGNQIDVVHQTGKADYDRVLQEYHNRGLKGQISPFIHDMATAYNQSDLIISRAGASTIFELAVLGKPSILIPYPYATNQHQKINAETLARAGGAEVVIQDHLDGKSLGDLIMRYMDNRSGLIKMGELARKFGRPDAAMDIVNRLLTSCQKKDKSRRQ